MNLISSPKKISKIIRYDHSVQEIANIMASVFNEQFGEHDNASAFLSVAQQIKNELTK